MAVTASGVEQQHYGNPPPSKSPQLLDVRIVINRYLAASADQPLIQEVNLFNEIGLTSRLVR